MPSLITWVSWFFIFTNAFRLFAYLPQIPAESGLTWMEGRGRLWVAFSR